MRPELRPDDPHPPLRRELRPLTDEDGEVRELTAEDFKGMRPVSEVDPGMIEAVAEYRRKRGRPKSPAPKMYIGFRLAPDVVDSVKASGPGYNARVEQALRNAGFGAAAAQPAGVEDDPLAKLSRLVEYSHLDPAKASEKDIVAAVQAATKRAAKKAAKPPAPAKKRYLKAKEPVTPATPAKKRA